MSDKDPGQQAFETYNEAVGGTTHDGKPLHWGMIGERQRAGWAAVEHKAHVDRELLLGMLNHVFNEAKEAADRGAEVVYGIKVPEK